MNKSWNSSQFNVSSVGSFKRSHTLVIIFKIACVGIVLSVLFNSHIFFTEDVFVHTAIVHHPLRKKSVVATYPYRLIIPKIHVNARIFGMGTTSHGRMAVPHNFTDIGWYMYGATPGNLGSAVMGAHVDNGASIPGVFKYLKKLSVGDDIYVLDEAGNTLHFQVLGRKLYGYQTKTTHEIFALNDRPRLNLITCNGKWLPQKKTYNKRLVVFTEMVKAS